MGDTVAADFAAMLHHFLDLVPAHRPPAAADIFLVNVDGEREPKLAQTRIGIAVNALPAVIHGDDDGFFRNVFLASFPCHHFAQ